MLRQAPRTVARLNAPKLRPLPTRRLINTTPPAQTSRSLKNHAFRFTLALGLLYWYNTSNVFAEEAAFPVSQPLSPTEETTLPTIDDIARQRQQQKQESQSQSQSQAPPPAPQADVHQETASPPLSEAEEEASSEGAFNEETGEINWDCPCLGGMAHGPCGEEFRAAFSCFVYSKEDPKGMECIDRFKGMQGCFRDHPDVYGDELERQEGDVEDELEEREEKTGSLSGEVAVRDEGVAGAEGKHQGPSIEGRRGGDAVGVEAATGKEGGEGEESKEKGSSTALLDGPSAGDSERKTESPVDGPSAAVPIGATKSPEGENPTERAKAAKEQVEKDHGEATSESDEIVPKAAHDAR